MRTCPAVSMISQHTVGVKLAPRKAVALEIKIKMFNLPVNI